LHQVGTSRHFKDYLISDRIVQSASCLSYGKSCTLLPFIVIDLFLNNQPDALIIQIYFVMKLYMFRASSLPIIRNFLLYIRHL